MGVETNRVVAKQVVAKQVMAMRVAAMRTAARHLSYSSVQEISTLCAHLASLASTRTTRPCSTRKAKQPDTTYHVSAQKALELWSYPSEPVTTDAPCKHPGNDPLPRTRLQQGHSGQQSNPDPLIRRH